MMIVLDYMLNIWHLVSKTETGVRGWKEVRRASYRASPQEPRAGS